MSSTIIPVRLLNVLLQMLEPLCVAGNELGDLLIKQTFEVLREAECFDLNRIILGQYFSKPHIAFRIFREGVEDFLPVRVTVEHGEGYL